MSVLKAVRKHLPLCASQFVRDGTVAVIQERGENGKRCELHYSVAKGVWQGSTLSSATFCLTFWEQDVRSDGTGKQRGTCDGDNRERGRLHSELRKRKGRLCVVNSKKKKPLAEDVGD